MRKAVRPDVRDFSRFTPWANLSRQERLGWLSAALSWDGYTTEEAALLRQIRAVIVANDQLSTKHNHAAHALLEREWIEGLNP